MLDTSAWRGGDCHPMSGDEQGGAQSPPAFSARGPPGRRGCLVGSSAADAL